MAQANETTVTTASEPPTIARIVPGSPSRGRRRDVAVVLLDVVMEGEDAGLKAVDYIRNELRLRALRIILRTGQPGYAPELEAIANFDINDYKTKTELTRGKLFTTIMAAVRSFEQIRRLEASRSGLELIIAGVSGFNAEQGLQVFASAVIAQLAALLGVPADGIFCLRSEGDQACAGSGAAGQPAILAATGRHLLTANKPLAALPDPAHRIDTAPPGASSLLEAAGPQVVSSVPREISSRYPSAQWLATGLFSWLIQCDAAAARRWRN